MRTIILFLSSLLITLTSTQAQETSSVVLENKTEACTYLVKVNVVREGSCMANGNGPLLLLRPETKLQLPPLPIGFWVMGFGIEEVCENPGNAELVSIPKCMTNIQRTTYFGPCRASVSVERDHLLITAE